MKTLVSKFAFSNSNLYRYIVGASGTTFKTWVAIPVLAMYPLSLGFVCFLDFVVGLK